MHADRVRFEVKCNGCGVKFYRNLSKKSIKKGRYRGGSYCKVCQNKKDNYRRRGRTSAEIMELSTTDNMGCRSLTPEEIAELEPTLAHPYKSKPERYLRSE